MNPMTAVGGYAHAADRVLTEAGAGKAPSTRATQDRELAESIAVIDLAGLRGRFVSV